MSTLATMIDAELDAPAPAFATEMAAHVAATFEGAVAVLFYGSVLRTGDTAGVLDFYVLTRGASGLAGRLLWPDVSYHEMETAGGVLRAKVASMALAQFQQAVAGTRIDTTIWTRFVQPSALIWTSDATVRRAVCDAVAQAAVTATSFAAALGPARGQPLDYWRALFRQTYAAEFRVEAAGREAQILEVDPGRYQRLLEAAWAADGLAVESFADGEIEPALSIGERGRRLAAWRWRRRLGKPLNLARLVKAAFTFQGAARYAAWKIERHTGLNVPLTPWRERHVILASPGVFWRLWRARLNR